MLLQSLAPKPLNPKRFPCVEMMFSVQPSVACLGSSPSCQSMGFTGFESDPKPYHPVDPKWEFPKIRGTLLWGPYNKDPTILGYYIRVPYSPK